jgi:hypothetical protein
LYLSKTVSRAFLIGGNLGYLKPVEHVEPIQKYFILNRANLLRWIKRSQGHANEQTKG